MHGALRFSGRKSILTRESRTFLLLRAFYENSSKRMRRIEPCGRRLSTWLNSTSFFTGIWNSQMYLKSRKSRSRELQRTNTRAAPAALMSCWGIRPGSASSYKRKNGLLQYVQILPMQRTPLSGTARLRHYATKIPTFTLFSLRLTAKQKERAISFELAGSIRYVVGETLISTPFLPSRCGIC